MRSRALSRTARAATAGVVLLALMATTACNPGRPPAAEVGGADISAERVDDMLDAFVEGAPEIYRGQIEGEGDGTIQMAAATAILNSLVLQVLQAELADDIGAVPGEADVEEATGLVQASFVAGASQPGDQAPTEEGSAALAQSTAIFEAMPQDLQDWLVELRATTIALGRQAASEVDAGEPTDADQLCLRAIVVPTDQVPDVQARLDDGEDFGAVSTEVSSDPELAASGGELGQDCLTADAYLQNGLLPEIVELVRDLDEGEASEPIELGEGVSALFEVQDRLLDEDSALAAFVQQSLADVDVRIDPRFGTWDPATGSITPPAGSRVPDVDLPIDAVPGAGG